MSDGDGVRGNRQVHIRLRMLGRFVRALLQRKADHTFEGEEDAANEHDRAKEHGRDKTIGRSAAIWAIDCGSSGAAEHEILAIFNPVYDAERFGFHLAASPRHADFLLVSGPLTRNMEAALIATFRAMPDQRRVVTLGDAFFERSIFGDSYAVIPLPEEITAACVAHIPGDPPSPADILAALRKIA